MPRKTSNMKLIIVTAFIISMIIGGFVFFQLTKPKLSARWITPEHELDPVQFILTGSIYVTELVTETVSTEGYEKIEFRLYEHINAMNENATPEYLYVGGAYVESSPTFIGGSGDIYYALPDGALNLTRPSDIAVNDESMKMADQGVRWYWNATVEHDAYYVCRFTVTHSNGQAVVSPVISFTTVREEYYPSVTLLRPTPGILTPLNDTFEVRVLISDNVQGLGQNTTQSISWKQGNIRWQPI